MKSIVIKKFFVLYVLSSIFVFADAISAQSPSDGFNPDANKIISAMAARPDGKILVGGLSTNIAELSRSEIYLLNPSSKLNDTF